MSSFSKKHIIHLCQRAGFGPAPEDLSYFFQKTKEEILDKWFDDSANVTPLTTVPLKKYPYHYRKANLSAEEKKANIDAMRLDKQQLSYDWFVEMLESKAQLREKMALFWHDHFACNIKNPVKIQRQINHIREHALGYFGDLVMGIAKDPAMIDFLNNQENVKDHPNENFTRELLELFTIGIGKYSEKDIQEAARAFTGWSYDQDGMFTVRRTKHDPGKKLFLGNEDYYSGEDIVNLILENQKTGEYIVSKLYFFLVGNEIPAERLSELANQFYQSSYHIGKLVREILSSDWFYEDVNVGNKIKSPIELLAGIIRLTHLKFDNGTKVLKIQDHLEQKLLWPPGVAGWVNGIDWLDLNALAERIELAGDLLLEQKNRKRERKSISTEGFDLLIKKNQAVTQQQFSLFHIKSLAESMEGDQLAESLASLIYSVNDEHLKADLRKWNNQFKRGKLDFKELLTTLLSQPEYQMN